MKEDTPGGLVDELIELVAALVHEQWCHWMEHMMATGQWSMDYNTYILPGADAMRWKHQMVTPYPYLKPSEKESDRKIAARFVEILDQGGFLKFSPLRPEVRAVDPTNGIDRAGFREKFAEKLARQEGEQNTVNLGKNYGSNSGVT